MRPVDFLSFFIGLCAIRRAVFREIDTESLRHILHSETNITYFEPVGYEREYVVEQHKVACENPDGNVIVIELYAFDRYFTLILQHDTTLFDKDMRVKSKSRQGITNINAKVNEFYKGKVSGDPSSFVTIRIYNGIVDGCFYTKGELYHIEPSSRYFINPVPFHSLIYRSRDVDFNLSSVKTMGKKVEHWKGYDGHSENKVLRQSRDIKLSNNITDANTCALHIAADHYLFSQVGKGSVDDTVAEMIFHIAEADKIFRSTDFNGDGGPGDNIGFTIAAITVYQDESAEDFFTPPSSDDTLDYLTEWSKLNHDAFCLSILFSYKAFDDGVLGLAWVGDQNTGGICSKRVLPENSTERMNFNTAIVTLSNRGVRIPRKASLVTVTHELGHSFGAKHDPRECIPDEEAGGYYVMYEKATDGTQPNNYLLSECSIAEMWPIIYYKGPQCFTAHHRGIYCGNKIIEEGEECDCGTPAECERVDACCNPGNVTSGVSSCKVKDGFQCSPKKGPCCTQDCKYITSQNVVCHEESECSFKSLCNSNNATCPQPLPKPSNTTCNHGSNTCLDGVCIGSICTAYTFDQCECTEYEELCQLCCNHTENGCISAGTLSGHVIYQPTGSPCKHSTGYCNEYRQCIIVDNDNQYIMFKEAFKRLVSKASLLRFTRWIKENWYIIIILVLSATAVLLLLKYRCSDVLSRLTRRSSSIQPQDEIPLNNINDNHQIQNEGDDRESTTL